MANTFRLPAYDAAVPEVNRLLQPIMQGWDAGLQDKQRGIENDRQNKLMGFRQQEADMSQARFGMDKEKYNEQKAQAVRERWGNRALLTLQETDEGQRAQKWQTFMATHPQADTLDPTYHDARTGPLKVLGDAGMAQAYLDNRIKQQAAKNDQARLGLTRSADTRAAAAHLANMAQYENMTPKQREEAAPALGLKPATPSYYSFVADRKYAPPSDTVTINEGQTIYQTGRDPSGKPTYTPIVQGNEKPPAEHTAKAANFVARMVEAERNVRKIVDGVDPVTGAEGPAFGAANNTVVAANMMPEAVRNMVISPQHQQYRQAAEQWIRAFLRKESGAAIGADEFKRDFVVYFPQPGDSPEVTAQKTEARHAAMAGIAGEAGNYFQKLSPKAATMLKQFEPNQKPQAAQDGAPVRVNSPQDAARLPPGTRFIGHDGVERVVR